MTRWREAVHVAVKDLRMARWWAGGWLLLVSVAVGAAGWAVTDEPSGRWLLALLTLASAMMIAAVLVQQDAPLDPDAFWVTRSLAPSSVWLGKLLAIVVLLVVPTLAGQMAAAARFDADVATHLRILGSSAAVLALWLGLAMALAAATRNLRHFILALLAVLVAIVVSFSIPSGGAGQPFGLAPARLYHPVWLVASPVLLAALAAWLYARRAVPVHSAAAIAAAALVAIAGSHTIAGPRMGQWTATPDLSADAVPLSGTVLSTNSLQGGVTQLVLRADVPIEGPDLRHVFRATHAYVEEADGRRDALGLVQGRGVAAAPQPQQLAGSMLVGVNVNQRQAARLAAAEARIIVLGDWRTQRRWELPDVPQRGCAGPHAAGTAMGRSVRHGGHPGGLAEPRR